MNHRLSFWPEDEITKSFRFRHSFSGPPELQNGCGALRSRLLFCFVFILPGEPRGGKLVSGPQIPTRDELKFGRSGTKVVSSSSPFCFSRFWYELRLKHSRVGNAFARTPFPKRFVHVLARSNANVYVYSCR